MSQTRHIALYKDQAGLWIAECPSLPGCQSFGATREEALSQVKDTIQLFMDAANEIGDPIAPDQPDDATRQLWSDAWQDEGLPVPVDQVEITAIEV